MVHSPPVIKILPHLKARYTRFYLEFFKFNEDEARCISCLVPGALMLYSAPTGSSLQVVSLDDILGADLVNKENIVKQPLGRYYWTFQKFPQSFSASSINSVFAWLVLGSGSAVTRLCDCLGR